MKKALLLSLLASTTYFAAQAAPIHDAVDEGNLDAVQTLITADPTLVNATTTDNETPLHIAVSIGTPELVRLLVEHGANMFARDRDGDIPLMAAKSVFESLQNLPEYAPPGSAAAHAHSMKDIYAEIITYLSQKMKEQMAQAVHEAQPEAVPAGIRELLTEFPIA